MRFEDEGSIRAYQKVHPLAPLWGFFGQCLYLRLSLAADRAGLIELPEGLRKDLPRAVAHVVRCEDVDWVAQYLPRLMAGPVPAVALHEDTLLVLTSYCDEQYTSMIPAAAQRWSREKRTALQRAVELGLIADVAKTA